MRRIICIAALLVLFSAPAAADRPALFTWTGFYVGAGGGAGAMVNVQSESIPGFGTVLSEIFGAQTYFGTVTAGYDYRVAPRVVVGALFDFELGRILFNNADLSILNLPPERARTWSFGGRVGYLVNPQTLLYVLGGFARSSMEFQDIGNVKFSGRFVGGGVETQLTGNWSLRGEYRFTQFSEEAIFASCFCGDVYAEPSMHTGRVLLLYRFGGAVPPP